MPDRRPFVDLDKFMGYQQVTSETAMPDQRPLVDRHAPSETDIPIGDWQACGDSSETNMPAESNRSFDTYTYYIYIYIYYIYTYTCILNAINTYFYIHLLVYIYWNNARTLSNQVCRYLMGLRLGMMVSNVSPIRACRVQYVSG